MADQGASQRRGTESAVSLISQANTTTPPESYTTSGFSSNFGPVLGNDSATIEERPHEVGITTIGGSTTVTGNYGTYTTAPLGQPAIPDYGGQLIRPKETGVSLLGQTTPETGAHGTSYTTIILGAQTPIGGGTGTTVTTYYKLRARNARGHSCRADGVEHRDPLNGLPLMREMKMRNAWNSSRTTPRPR